LADGPQIAELVSPYVSQGELLPRPLDDIYESIREWWVIEEGDGQIVACGSLLIMWADLAEVRSLAVRPDQQGKGLGRQIVTKLLEDARALGIPRIFALTRQVAFFEKLGFSVTTWDALPRKVWKDCMYCFKFPTCDETAVVLDLADS
jgi:amino-acid N-acetyltransferase